jgi:hypothetical protein
MAKTINAEEVGDLKTFQAVCLIFSILFLFVVGNGYYNLFLTKIGSYALVVALLLSALAWLLAKLIGTNKGKILGNLPLFFLLLIISSVGVFNAMMLNLEGKMIYTEAIDDAKIQFVTLRTASKELITEEILQKISAINDKKEKFLDEVKNPLNCGQGPVAIQRAQELKALLPAFQMLSNPAGSKSCDKTPIGEDSPVIVSYRSSIDALLYNHPDLVKARYKENKEFISKIDSESETAQEQLKDLETYVNSGDSLLKDNHFNGKLVKSARGKLEDITTNYANLAVELKNYAPKAELQMNLNITDVRSLGEWSQLANLILDRLDKPSTYVYFGLSVFFDWILIYLFTRLSSLKAILKQQNPKANIPNSGIPSAWQDH